MYKSWGPLVVQIVGLEVATTTTTSLDVGVGVDVDVDKFGLLGQTTATAAAEAAAQT